MKKTRNIAYLIAAAALGMGLGESAWALSVCQPDFWWPQWSRLGFWGAGAGLGLLWTAVLPLMLRLAFFWDLAFSRRLAARGLLPLLLGFGSGLVQRVPLPPPQGFPLRKIEILLAAQVILSLSLALAFCLDRLRKKSLPAFLSPFSAALRLSGLAWIFLLSTAVWTGNWHVTGDAPHYLLLTHSLAYDGDAELSNNYARGDWLLFYNREKLEPQVPSQKDGRQYSEHKTGLPLLMAPAYRLFGFAGALWTLTLLAAAGGALFYLLLFRLGYGPGLCLLGWSLFCFTAPWWTQSSVALPEMCGGLFFLAALAAYRKMIPVWCVPAVCFLAPWFSLRYNTLSLGLALGMVFSKQRKWFWTGLSLATAALSLAALWLFEASHLGSFNPIESYHQRHQGLGELLRPFQIPRYVSGLLLDQEFGWLPFAPVFLLSFLGLRAWWKRDRDFFWQMAVPALAYLGPVASFYGWYSDMAPNRYLVPLFPVCCLLALECWRAWGSRASFAVLAAGSWAWGILMAVLPWLCWSKHDGQNWLLRIAGGLAGLNLTAFFPSFMITKPDSYLWMFGLALLLAAAIRRLGPPRQA